MTNKDFFIKWVMYIAALLLILFFQTAVLNGIRIFGVSPVIIPVVIATVATFEGPEGGSGFGLIAGVLYDAAFSVPPGLYIIFFTLIGAAAGMITDYLFPKSAVSCFVFSFAALIIMALVQIIRLLITERTGYLCMLHVAGIEVLFSMLFFGPVFLLIRGIYNSNSMGEI